MSTEELQASNNKTLGTAAGVFPIVTLPDGRKVPTGTVGALLANIKLYDESDATDRATLKEAIRSAIPTLYKVGMFDIFPPEDWMTSRSPGRSIVKDLAEEYIA